CAAITRPGPRWAMFFIATSEIFTLAAPLGARLLIRALPSWHARLKFDGTAFQLGFSVPPHLPGGSALMKTPSARTYFFNGAALLAFLALTIAAAYVNLGPFNTVASMSIALLKAALIVLFFMHLRYSKPVMWVFAGAGVFWLAIMFVLALADYLTRGWS
ncbi:MAG: cytochrome C oxidase subunit IV family protein, partial [Verrucomicrobiota bacterium]|nr:cytochrome C oxidase subunit IV family protein [Verrucomicrobiota bacterium]